ncbi:MAG TPA: LON peptidase substrate-binding domain-containing protein [Vicinamibacterales bacterium]
MLPPTIPIFPLPNVVLFPNVFLPLHIFEPRYRALLADALAGDRIIGMSLLQPGFDADYHGRPPVYRIGCAGVITHAERLADGRSNVVLRGLEKFRIVNEDHSREYRTATIDALPETTSDQDRSALRQHRQRLEALLVVAIERGGADPKFPPAIADDDLVNALAQYLGFDVMERQALLERDGIIARCRGLIELLEMKTFDPPGGRWGGGSGGVH